MEKLNTLKGVKKINVKPQYDKYVLPNDRTIYLLAEMGSAAASAAARDASSRATAVDEVVNRYTRGACAPVVNLGCATGHPKLSC